MEAKQTAGGNGDSILQSRGLVLGAVLLLGLGASLGLLDRTGWRLAANTSLLLLGTLALALPGGTLLGLLLARTVLPTRRMILAALAAVVVLPVYFHAAAWLAVFGPFGLLAMGGPGADWFPLLGSVWIHGLYGSAWVALIVYTAAAGTDPALEQQALLWLDPWSVLWRVTLRGLWPAVAAAGAWVSALTAAEITVTDLLRLRTFAEEFYLWLSLTAGEEGAAEAVRRTLAGALLSVTVAWTALALAAPWLVQRHPRRNRFRMRLPRTGATALAAWCWIVLLLGIPLAALVHQAGLQVEQTAQGWLRSWSAAKAGRTLVQSLWQYRAEVGWSALIAAAAATAALVLAVPLAYGARRRHGAACLLWLLAAGTLAVPGPWLGWATLLLFRTGGHAAMLWLYDHSIAAPVTVQTLRALGPMLLLLWVAWATVPRGMEEQAATLGLSGWERFCRVMLPLRRRWLVAAWFLGLLAAWNELPGTLLVLPPGVDTLPRQLFGLLHARVEDQVAGACLGLLGLTLLGTGAMSVLLEHKHRDHSRRP